MARAPVANFITVFAERPNTQWNVTLHSESVHAFNLILRYFIGCDLTNLHVHCLIMRVCTNCIIMLR